MIKVMALLKRRHHISREDFAHRWLYEHKQLSSKPPGLRGDRINILTPYQPAQMNTEPPCDGTAELWWDSFAYMDSSFEIGKILGADADSFARCASTSIPGIISSFPDPH